MASHPEPVPVDGRTARRAGTREAILLAATELFAARGVTSTSVDDIAERAGIAKGSIYYNFSSKAGLVEAVIDAHSRILRAELEDATRGLTGAERRAAVVTALLRTVQSHADAARVMVTEMFRTERSWLDAMVRWRDIVQQQLRDDYLAEHPQGGAAAAAVQSAAVVGAALTAGLEWLAFNPDQSLESVRDAVLTALALPVPPG